jgi:hypothetical protein
MKFYEIDVALLEAITTADKPVRVRIDIDRGGHLESDFDQDIWAADYIG